MKGAAKRAKVWVEEMKKKGLDTASLLKRNRARMMGSGVDGAEVPIEAEDEGEEEGEGGGKEAGRVKSDKVYFCCIKNVKGKPY